MANDKTPKKVVTGKVRLSYCNLVTPRARDEKSAPTYSTALIIPKDADGKATLKRLRAAEKAALDEALENRKFTQREVDQGLRTGGAKGVKPSIIKDGDEDADLGKNPEYEGCWYMNVSSGTKRPGIVDRKVQLIPLEDLETEIYSGAYVRVSLSAFAYDRNGNKGISFGLDNVQKLADGETFGGGSRAQDDFDALDDADDDDDEDLL